MPHRRLVKIGEPTSLPTISQFLKEMAARQHEEIQRLKSEALSGKLPDPTVPEEHHEDLTPDPWQLHPVRIKKSTKKSTAKKSKKLPKRTVRAKLSPPKAASKSRPKTKARTSNSSKKTTTKK
jgi:hypothetical protein